MTTDKNGKSSKSPQINIAGFVFLKNGIIDGIACKLIIYYSLGLLY